MAEWYIPLSEDSKRYIKSQLRQAILSGEKMLEMVDAGKRGEALAITRDMDNFITHIRSTVANNMTEKEAKK